MTFDAFRKKVQDVDSREHSALLKKVKGLVGISRKEMSKNYNKWDEYDAVFRSRRALDKEDVESQTKGQPAKMIVPLTYSQVMTFVAFAIMTMTQNKRFFELEPTGSEDDVLQEPLELIVERDLRRNQWTAFLVQFFLDIGRFCLGAAEVCYKEEYRNIRLTENFQTEGAFGNVQQETRSGFKKLPFFVGNRVYPISPYHFFPDTRIALTRYQEGEFCASEDIFAYSSLLSQDGLFNLDKIPKWTESGYKSRQKVSRVDLGLPAIHQNPNLGEGDGDSSTSMVTSGECCVTKVCFDLIPKYWKDEGDPWFEPSIDFPVRYLCWYANDKTIVRFEEAYYLHGMFPYISAQYTPDQHEYVNEGISSVCDQINALVTWKINAHMASQKNSVESKWIVDPAGVDVKTLESRSPYIFLKRNASQTGVDRYIKQFKTEDVTAGVFNDVAALDQILQQCTGLSALLQGQYSQGRRSATQDRVVAQGASARGKTSLGAIWDTAFEPLGKQLMINNRQEMNLDTFSRILGKRTWPVNTDTGVPYTTEEIFALFKSTPEDLAQNEDFFVYDGTLPSEKAFLAQSLQEIFTTMLSNPMVAQTLGVTPEFIQSLFSQIYLLRGVTPARLPALTPVAPAGVTPTGGPQISALPTPPTRQPATV